MSAVRKIDGLRRQGRPGRERRDRGDRAQGRAELSFFSSGISPKWIRRLAPRAAPGGERRAERLSYGETQPIETGCVFGGGGEEMTHRIHVSLAARDVEASRRFYETLFGVAPVKVKPGYAKFSVAEPSVNLSLVASEAPGTPGPVRHYGIEVGSTEDVLAAHGRLRAAGFATMDEAGTTCCFAVQDKVWAVDPDGNRWEVFVVLEDAETFGVPPALDELEGSDEGAPRSGPCCG